MNKIYHGDCLDVMKGMEENSVDAVVCDPPYGLFFMGQTWDKGTPPVPFWKEALRIAKPGAYLLAFGGTRTFHRLACAIEDAGWVLRDTMMWVYGSGFPKSHDVSKALDRKAGAEREVVGKETVGAGITSGSMHAGRESRLVERDVTVPSTPEAKQWDGFGTALKPSWEPIILAQKPIEGVLLSEIRAITGRRRWHLQDPKKAWTGKVEDEKSWKQSQCYKQCEKYGLEWWEKEADEGKIERWIFERCWLALEPRAQSRHVVIGKNKRVVLGRTKYKDSMIINTAANVIKWGCGALNIGACRIGAETMVNRPAGNKARGASLNMSVTGMPQDAKPTQAQGRWPANFLLSHSVFCEKVGEKVVKSKTPGSPYSWHGKKGSKGKMHIYRDADGLETIEDWRCVPECPVRMLDEQSGASKSTVDKSLHAGRNGTSAFAGAKQVERVQRGDQGGASRFFYCSKASRRERNAGLEDFEKMEPGRWNRAGKWTEGTTLSANNHPTVKPITLLRYLCRLVTPPAGRSGMVLDPFAGSGSTGCAAALEGFRFVGVEKELEYVEIARARIKHWEGQRGHC